MNLVSSSLWPAKYATACGFCWKSFPSLSFASVLHLSPNRATCHKYCWASTGWNKLHYLWALEALFFSRILWIQVYKLEIGNPINPTSRQFGISSTVILHLQCFLIWPFLRNVGLDKLALTDGSLLVNCGSYFRWPSPIHKACQPWVWLKKQHFWWINFCWWFTKGFRKKSRPGERERRRIYSCANCLK